MRETGERAISTRRWARLELEAADWQNQPATAAQIQALRRRGLKPAKLEGMTKGAASDLLDKPTRKQAALLKKHGRWVEDTAFSAASKAINELIESWDH